MRIVVLMGGRSSEREISLKTGKAVAKALRELGHKVYELDLSSDLPCKLIEINPDKVFIALHGKFGEDGTVQGMLEILEVPYTGSDTIASAVSIDKDFAKRIVKTLGINTPDWDVFIEERDIREKKWNKFPAIVKPAREGSSVGIRIVRTNEELEEYSRELLKKVDKVIVEEFIEGRDLTVSILKGKALPVIEIKPKKKIYDYECKYTKGMSDYIFINEESLSKKLQEIAKKIYKYFSLKDFARVDFRVSNKDNIYFLEINTIPGMTELSLLPMAAKEEGIDFKELINIIIS